MTFDPTKTVGELASEAPSATRVFERFRIDYCCGGKRTLPDACVAAGANLDEVLGMLEGATAAAQQPGESRDFQNSTLAELVGHILDQHHAHTREEMGRITALADKVCAAHGERHGELPFVRELFGELCADLGPHMLKEERVLFPYVLALEEAATRNAAPPCAPFGTVGNPVRMMVYEHDMAGEFLRALRKATGGYAVPADACASYRTLYGALEEFERDLHRHIHLENNILFPRAVELENKVNSI
jgi:regulator of cell morphogenesis and NO signaling